MSTVRDIYRGRIVWLRLEEVTLPNSVSTTLEIVHHPGAAAIAAVDDENRVVLVHQYRHAAGGYIWEVPAGVIHSGEPPASCAARELREEVGITAARWTALGSILVSPGFCDERIHLFLARDLAEGPQQLDHDEVLTPSRVPLSEALAMIRRGDIQDAKTIAALHHVSATLADEGAEATS